MNEPSKRVAVRTHFTFEGIQRSQRVVPVGKIGNGFDRLHLPNVVGGRLGQSRDSAVFAHYCDKWPEKWGGVLAVMDRGWRGLGEAEFACLSLRARIVVICGRRTT